MGASSWMRRSPPPPLDRSAFSGQQPAVSGTSRARTVLSPSRRSVEAPAVSAPERLQRAETLLFEERVSLLAETAAEAQHAQQGVTNISGLRGLAEGGLRGLATVSPLDSTSCRDAKSSLTYHINPDHLKADWCQLTCCSLKDISNKSGHIPV